MDKVLFKGEDICECCEKKFDRIFERCSPNKDFLEIYARNMLKIKKKIFLRDVQKECETYNKFVI